MTSSRIPYITSVVPNDWNSLLRFSRDVQKYMSSLSKSDQSVVYSTLTLTGLGTNTLIYANSSNELTSATIGTGLSFSAPTLSLSHLGLENLTDPDADRILFWDESNEASKWLSLGDSLEITDTVIDTIQDIRTTASPTFVKLILEEGTGNVGIGSLALNTLTTGQVNMGVGTSAGEDITEGSNNNLIGNSSGASLTTGSNNVCIGSATLQYPTTASYNTAIGHLAMRGLASAANQNTVAIGALAGYSSSGDGNIFLGCRAGRYQTTTSNCFLVDNQDRTDAATELTSSLIYGTFDATPANQTLTVNGALTAAQECRSNVAFNLNGVDGISDSDAGVITASTISGGILTAVTKNDWLDQGVRTSDSPTFTGITSALGRINARPVSDTSIAEAIRLGRTGSDFRYHSIYQSCNATTNSYLEFRIHDGGVSPYTGQTSLLRLEGYTPQVSIRNGGQLSVDGIITGKSGAKIGDGGTTDYLEIETDGTLEFHGDATVWKDANVGTLNLGTGTGATRPTVVSYYDEAGADTGIACLGFDINESVSGAIEFQHDYKEGSDITFHIHWQGIAAPTGTDYVKWQLVYTVARDTQTLDAATTIVVETPFDTRYAFERSDLPTITGTNFKIGDQLLFKLKRITAAGDAYAGDALAGTVGMHYECDTVGSRSIVTK